MTVSPTPNFDAWQLFMKDFRSPQSFVDWGFYYLISACLQRRVWVGPEHSPLFPNQYIILTAEPGIGKGLVIKQVEYFLKFYKLRNPINDNMDASTEEKALKLSAAIEDYENAKKQYSKDSKEEPLRIPMAPSASTYEALVEAMAKAVRTINYTKFDEKLGKNTPQIYAHHSLAFNLEEISSLFRKHTHDVVNSLLVYYDCGDYEKITRTQGKDFIRKCCLNFFGGTTPKFMRDTFNDKLIGEGFSSRTIFVYAVKNRHNELFIPELSQEQKDARAKILAHIQTLFSLYGQATFTDEAKEYLAHWFKNIHPIKKLTSPLMQPYNARKDIHMQKLAMAMHFGESNSMTIGLEPVLRAEKALEQTEPFMQYAIAFDDRNPLARSTRNVVNLIQKEGPMTTADLLTHFWEELRDSELKEILEFCSNTSKLHLVTVRNKRNKSQQQAWFIEPQVDMSQYKESKYESTTINNS